MILKMKEEKNLDYELYNERHVLLSIAYAGHSYSGLAFQRDNRNTIEEILFDAFRRTKLCRFKPLQEETVNSTRKSSTQIPVGFSRCGRTDSQVSAFSNAVALHMRSQLGPNSDQHNTFDSTNNKSFVRLGSRVEKSRGYNDRDEIDYIYLLNKRLPPHIRVTAWSPVPDSFDARHSCVSRSYRYYFFPADYDLTLMKKASTFFIGSHNFVNFCKKDALVQNYYRRINTFDIRYTRSSTSLIEIEPDGEKGMAYFYVTGNAFLHHQIRYMVSLLFEIGSHHLPLDTMSRYLDPAVPIQNKEFCLASAENLCFWECNFSPEIILSWNYSFRGRNLKGPNVSALSVRSEKEVERSFRMDMQKHHILNIVDSGFVKLFKKSYIQFVLLHEMDIAIKKREVISE